MAWQRKAFCSSVAWLSQVPRAVRQWRTSGSVGVRDGMREDGCWRGGGWAMGEACWSSVAWLLQVPRVVRHWWTSGNVGVGDVERVDGGWHGGDRLTEVQWRLALGATAMAWCGRERRKIRVRVLVVWRKESDEVSFHDWVCLVSGGLMM